MSTTTQAAQGHPEGREAFGGNPSDRLGRDTGTWFPSFARKGNRYSLVHSWADFFSFPKSKPKMTKDQIAKFYYKKELPGTG